MKKISILLLLTLCTFSCKDFLDEELKSTVSYDYYETEAGIEDLVDGVYGDGLRWKFNGEQSFTLFNYGVDEYKQASDGQNKYFDDYKAQLNASSAYIHDMWLTYYRCINMANLAIEKITAIDVAKSSNTVYRSETFRQGRLGEMRFLRAFLYFSLLQQFGSIPLVLDGEIGVRTELPRSSVSGIYSQIIKDMRYAESVLAKTQTYGRISKGAAMHYLAKVYLTRGSAVKEASIRGTKASDVDSAAYYADAVINLGEYSLQVEFADLWKIENEANKEVILSAPFNNNALLLNTSGNRVHLYFQMTYDVKPGMTRDINYGRPFRRLMPTSYTYDISDRKNDSRFYKSFRTAYISNTSTGITNWSAANAPSPDLVGKPKIKVGDTAVFLTLHPSISDADIAKKSYSWIPRNKFNLSDFPSLVKWFDPTRLDITTETAQRDGLYARLGETYLIAAEAYGRKGDFATATARLNKLRERAAYKAGETKPVHYYKTEGGTYGDINETYSKIMLPADGSYWDSNPARETFEQYPASAVDKATRFIHFMLNERTRELLGELHRWEDLVRTESLAERVTKFNPDAAAAAQLQDFHKLRPIPQEHIDRLWKNGAPITNIDDKKAEQNPGY